MGSVFRGFAASFVFAVAALGCGSGVTVSISPATATVYTGETQAFAAAVAGVEDTRVFWSVEEGDGAGTISSDGVYTAPVLPGTFHIVATSAVDPTRTAKATVTVKPFVAGQVSVTISPEDPTLTVGESQQFTAAVSGTSNQAVTWSIEEGASGGIITSDGLYTAPASIGVYHVVAQSVADPSKKAAVAVTVTSDNIQVTVTPSAVTLGAGQTTTFNASVAGTTNPAVTWTLQEGTAGGSITAGGFYTAPNSPGVYHVVATSQVDPTRSGTATVTVVPVSVSVAPQSALLEVGEQKTFAATVTGTSNLAVTWSVQEGAAGGSITQAGVYTAPSNPGTYHVVATSQADATKSAAATVEVLPVITVSIAPSPVTLSTSQTQQFTATVTGHGNTQVTWSVAQGAAGGTITQAGVYTAPATPGTYQVVAKSQANPAKSATVNVTVVQGVSVTVNPSAITLSAGGSQTFTATVGGTSNTQVTWSVQEGSAGGSITSGGVYTAPNKIGTFHVVATSKADTTRSGVATVTVVGKPVSVSGTVAYAGSNTGRIYLAVAETLDAPGLVGTSIGEPGTFTIRGLQQPGPFEVRAFMDTTGTGMLHRTVDPQGTATIEVSGSDITGVSITLEDPQPGTAGQPSLNWVAAGDRAVILSYEPATDFWGDEDADEYRVYWSNTPNPGPSNNKGSKTVTADSSQLAVVDGFGLTNGQSYYFAIQGLDNGLGGSVSNAIGPVTVGALTGGSTVSGTVSFSGFTSTGPMYVLAVGGGVRTFAKIASPASPQSYSIPGLPTGSYSLLAVIDQGGDGQLGVTDLNNFLEPMPITLSGNATASPISLSTAPVRTRSTTRHEVESATDTYHLSLLVSPNAKRPVKVTLTSGPKVAAPIDLALYELGGAHHVTFIPMGSTSPTVGDTYNFSVTYSDGTTGTASVQVGAVLAAPNLVAPVTTSNATPTFTWTAPNPAPSAAYTYTVQLFDFFGFLIGEKRGIPSTQTSVAYADLNPSQSSLNGFYSWTVTVVDKDDNISVRSATFYAE